jgi:gliding motility-associated-like protein
MISALKILAFTCLLTIVGPISSFALHIVGGDMYYDYLGNNNYKFYIVVYRDCNTVGGAQYDSPLNVGVFNAGNGRIMDVTFPFPGSSVLPIIFNNPCVVAPTGICTERAIYTKILNLPPIVGGYKVAYQRCCRQPTVLNLVQPDDQGITLMCTIPGSETGFQANSSPRFTNYPPLAICNNDILNFDHSATDPDGDQLVYSLITPYQGASPANPMPTTIPNPNYPLVTWQPGYGAANPLGPGSSVTINPTTGQLIVSPNLTGLYVVGVRVDEYRNGIYIGGNTRDFLFTVINCVITMQATLPLQIDLSTFTGYCDGLTVNFENGSTGGTNYLWDFGDPSTTADVSTLFQPTYTYPAPGTYIARLIVNPGWACTDTAYMTVILDNTFNLSFTATDSVCFDGNSINFAGTASPSFNPAQVSTYTWNFGPNATPTTANGLNVNGVVFNSAGVFPVNLSGVRGVCNADTTIDVTIFDVPVSNYSLPSNYECEGQTIQFTSTSTGAINYAWNFGDPSTTTDVSTIANPSYTYPNPGTYTIQLITGTNGTCFDTVDFTYQIYQDLIMSFTHQDSICITGNSFDFIGTVSGPAGITSYTWNFGPNSTPASATGSSAFGITYSTPGNHNITLSGSYLQCVEAVSSSVYLYAEPTIDFTIAPGGQCAPFLAQFIDLSTSNTPIQYLWDLGDGTMSTLQNPSHLYNNPGVYPITLNIKTNEGCIANLTMTQPTLVDIKPKPVSSFTTSTDFTDICNAEVIFIDQSTGASVISYLPDDNDIFASNVPANFAYQYQSSGYKNVIQIVQNEYGCEDRSTQQLYIEPFTVYIPNAFTPDGDQYNNSWTPVVALNSQEWHLEIYDRWGEKLWESFDQNAGWDGFYKGRKMQQGVFMYKLRYVSCGQEDKYNNLTGHFSLLK